MKKAPTLQSMLMSLRDPDLFDAKFPFGPNKRREIERLLFELAKREGLRPENILQNAGLQQRGFADLKRYLIARRYPSLTPMEQRSPLVLSKLDIRPEYRARLKDRMTIRPKTIFVEQAVRDSNLAKRFQRKFPSVPFRVIPSYKEYVKRQPHTLRDYNRRLENFFIVKERFDFLLNCPCSRPSISCGYQILNLGTGCGYECVYCHLQAYINSPGIVLPANIEDFFKAFTEDRRGLRLGTGQFTDSLIFDDLTGYSEQLVEFFRHHPKTMFEFKTKSDRIQALTKIPPAANIVVAWSLNPEKVIRTAEFQTPGLARRIKAARECAEWGYKTAFHFDPVILYPGWQKDYHHLIDRLADDISTRSVAWISIGALRLTPRLKTVIENRFPDNTILDGEFIRDFDGKLRYPFRLRVDLFGKMRQWVRRRFPKTPVYLCMEEPDLYKACRIQPPFA